MSQREPTGKTPELFPTPEPNQSADAAAVFVATADLPSTPPDAAQSCPESGCMDIDQAVGYLDDNAEDESQHHCAAAVRQAIEHGGVDLDPNTRPGSAEDYGPYLQGHGFNSVTIPEGHEYQPQRGDVIVIQGFPAGTDADGNSYAGNVYGHIEMWDGEQWVSDFSQPRHDGNSPMDDVYPGRAYRAAQPDYAIYHPPIASSGPRPSATPTPAPAGE
jgi:hypothetical protein